LRRVRNYDELLALATSAEAPFDAIIVWKTSRIAISLEETIALRDHLRSGTADSLSVAAGLRGSHRNHSDCIP
jgi:hypothetical protein